MVNTVYRSRIKHFKLDTNHIGEKVIVMNDLYAKRLINEEEEKVRVYLTRGTVGYITKCMRHAVMTKYVPIEFRPEFYPVSFTGLYMDRHYLNGASAPSRQLAPENIVLFKYAYALPVVLSRLGHWDKVTLLYDKDDTLDPEIQRRLMYTGVTRARQGFTLLI